MGARFARFVAVAALAAMVGACGDDGGLGADATTTQATEATEATASTEATATTAGRGEGSAAGTVVEVLDPGSEPRQELRLEVEAGSEQPVVLVQRQEQTVAVGGQEQSLASATELPITYRVDAVEDGRIELTSTYGTGRVLDDPPTDPATRQVMGDVIAAFDGATAGAVVDDRGAVVSVDAPDVSLPGVDPTLQSTILGGLESQASQLSVPFPEEPVGVGARWRVSAEADLGGLPIRLTTEVELTGVGDGVADGVLTTRLEFVPGETEIAGAPVEIVSGELTGQGDVRWDLSAAFPFVDQTIEGTATIAVEQGGQRFEIVQDQRQQITVRPA